MRRLFIVFALILLAACRPEPQPILTEPVLTLTSEATLEFKAAGGNGVITYTLENPTSDTTLEATCPAKWLQELTVGESITFSVDANDSSTPRETTITVAYSYLSFEVTVKQAAKDTTPRPEPDRITLDHLSGIYYGNYYGATDNDYNYSLVLSSAENCLDIITGEVLVAENNTYLFLDLYAGKPAENLNISFDVPQGEYKLDVRNSALAGTIGAKHSSLYITNEREGQEISFVDGSVYVTTEGIEAMLYDEAGNAYHYVSKSTSVDNSNNFGPRWAPAEQSTLTEDITISFDNGVIYAESYDDYYVVGKRSWMYYVDDYATLQSLSFELLTELNDEYPVGRFPLSCNLNNTQMALPGYVNGDSEAMWSWYNCYDAENNIIGSAPIVDGEITIEHNSDDSFTVTLNLVDDLGYKISGRCTSFLWSE